jgi:hypothetical protein
LNLCGVLVNCSPSHLYFHRSTKDTILHLYLSQQLIAFFSDDQPKQIVMAGHLRRLHCTKAQDN